MYNNKSVFVENYKRIKEIFLKVKLINKSYNKNANF